MTDLSGTAPILMGNGQCILFNQLVLLNFSLLLSLNLTLFNSMGLLLDPSINENLVSVSKFACAFEFHVSQRFVSTGSFS